MMDKEKITGQNENNEHEEKIPLLKKLSSGQSICRKISETYIYIDGGIHDKENEDKNDEEKTSFSEKLSSGSKACRKLAETIINLNRGTNEEQKTDHEDKKENENLLETLTSGSKMCRKIAERLIHEGKEAEEKIPFLKTLSSGRKMYTKLAEKFINADSDEQNEEEITEQDENEGDMPLLNILSNGEEACKKLAEKYLHVELPHIPINFHSYQQKKNWAHGMMNLALLSSHVGHVKSLLQQSFEDRSGLFYTNFMVTLISIFMQVMVSIGLVWNGRYDLNKPGHHHRKAHLLNNCTFSGTLVITVMNVILSALGVPTIPTNMPILIGNLTNIADVFNKIS